MSAPTGADAASLWRHAATRALTLRGDQVFIDNLVQAARRSGLELTIRSADKPYAPPIRVGGIEHGR